MKRVQIPEAYQLWLKTSYHSLRHTPNVKQGIRRIHLLLGTPNSPRPKPWGSAGRGSVREANECLQKETSHTAAR